MQDSPRVTNLCYISLSGMGVRISLSFRPRKIPMPIPPHETSCEFKTLGETCYSDTVAVDTEVGLFDGGHDGEHNAYGLVETSKRFAAQGDFFMVIAPRQQDNVT